MGHDRLHSGHLPQKWFHVKDLKLREILDTQSGIAEDSKSSEMLRIGAGWIISRFSQPIITFIFRVTQYKKSGQLVPEDEATTVLRNTA